MSFFWGEWGFECRMAEIKGQKSVMQLFLSPQGETFA